MPRRFRTLETPAELGQLQRELAERRRREQAEAERLARRRREERREADLFRAEMADEGVHPLAPPDRIARAPVAIPPLPRQREIDEAAALAESLSDEIDISRYLDVDESLSYHRPGVGPDVPRRLRRGDWTVVDQLDLHGLRVEEAREALVGFLAECRRRERRCVRIIHGKGLGSANREPVLRDKVPRWLAQRREVLAFCRARPNDGGSGALIVLLSVP
ncbi:MAG: Smr/MutS family protein [Pseudomonadota bacterium]|nr:Smr/MutS family protein [Pseudomonadota bacterium]